MKIRHNFLQFCSIRFFSSHFIKPIQFLEGLVHVDFQFSSYQTLLINIRGIHKELCQDYAIRKSIAHEHTDITHYLGNLVIDIVHICIMFPDLIHSIN